KEGCFERVEAVALVDAPDGLQHAPLDSQLQRPAIAEATRQSRPGTERFLVAHGTGSKRAASITAQAASSNLWGFVTEFIDQIRCRMTFRWPIGRDGYPTRDR